MAEETFETINPATPDPEGQEPEQPADLSFGDELADTAPEDVDVADDVVADEAAEIDEASETSLAVGSADVALAEADDFDEDDLTSEDSLTFSNGVIEKIVALAVRDVPGVLGMKGGWLNRVQDAFGAVDPRKGVTVEVTDESSVRVNIAVLIAYGSYAPQIFEDVKRAVVREVRAMTGLEVAGVNLRIEDVLTPEEYEAREGARQRTEPPAPAE